MSLFLDRDYTALSIILKRQCEARSIGFEMKELNPQGYGDAVVYGLDGIYSAEIKGAGEFIGDVDHCIAQLKAQMASCDFMHLFIYGEQEAAEDGNSYSLKLQAGEKVEWESRGDSGIIRRYVRRHHRVNHDAQRKILWRCRAEGIQVVECRDLEELAYEMCLWHETATTIGTTFTRLTPQKFFIREEDKPRRDFMLTLMGIQGAGVGEELADAICSWMSNPEEDGGLNEDPCLHSLIVWLEEDETLAKWPLRSGKRTVGPSAVKRLKTALGVA